MTTQSNQKALSSRRYTTLGSFRSFMAARPEAMLAGKKDPDGQGRVRGRDRDKVLAGNSLP